MQFLCGALLSALAVSAFCQTTDLPVKRVVLYRSGVGYIERSGTVSGNASLILSLREPQMNDLLKSLVMVDFDGGQIMPVQYTPRDPLSRTLSAFAIDISDNPSRAQLLYRLRGMEVEFKLRRRTMRGKVMSLESGNARDSRGSLVGTMFVNLMTPRGMERVALHEVEHFRVMDERLQRELELALNAIGSGLDNQRKTLELVFSGSGSRRVLVGYLTEMPQWKMTYRLIVGQGQPALLQGWAIVENTTDEDWNGVQLQLVSGRPVSFIQNLYEPFYPTRLRYVPPADTSLLPPIPQAGLGDFQEETRTDQRPMQMREPPFLASPDSRPMLASPMMAEGLAMARSTPEPRGFGGFGGAPAPRMAMEPEAMEKSTPEMAVGQERGALFDYRIEQPVSIARQRSALVPVINRSVEMEPVSLYNAENQRFHPFFGVRLKNTTGLTLMDGPLTIYLDGAYGGDSIMQTVEPNGERFLLYALDVGVEVNQRGLETTRQQVSVNIANGVLRRRLKEVRTTTYEIQNRDSKPRLLVLEHPREEEWEVSEPSTDDRTADFYRFRLTLEPQKLTTFKVAEEKPISEEFALLSADMTQIRELILHGKLPQQIVQALERIAEMRRTIASTEAQIRSQEARINAITQDQARIRENMRALDRNSDLYKEYVATLTRQERELAEIRQRLERLREQLRQEQQALSDYIANLNI